MVCEWTQALQQSVNASFEAGGAAFAVSRKMLTMCFAYVHNICWYLFYNT